MTTAIPPRTSSRTNRRDGAEILSSRERALAATHEALLEIGTTRTTMAEVARRSGLGRTTLYRHWNDISSLYAELLNQELAAAVDRLSVDTQVSEAHDADQVAEVACELADILRTNPMLDAFRRHEPEVLAVYLLQRLGTAQRHLIDALRSALDHAIATDPRLAGRDADRTAHMLFLAVQGVVLSAPIADPPLHPDAWRAELTLLVKGYLGL